jgi:thiol-disulfide isomerase/thioredoxin
MSKNKYSPARILVWVIYPIGLLAVIIFMFLTCGGKAIGKDKQEDTAVTSGTSDTSTGKGFPLPAIPAMLTSPQQRADYLVAHYWDNFNFSDTAYIHLPEITEQAFADYLDVLPHVEKQIADASIAGMLTKAIRTDATGRMYAYFLSKYKDYLYDPNSPLRNEEYYIPVTGYILEDSVSGMATKERAKFDLGMMLKNRVGMKSTNITYTKAGGKAGSLYSLGKEYTILYFYNPDCPACKETTAYLAASPVISGLLENGRLDILALYPDEDTALWRGHIPQMPPLWIDAIDKQQRVKDKLLYDLKAIPCLYLLDRDKMVLLKDANVQQVEGYLNLNGNK